MMASDCAFIRSRYRTGAERIHQVQRDGLKTEPFRHLREVVGQALEPPDERNAAGPYSRRPGPSSSRLLVSRAGTIQYRHRFLTDRDSPAVS
jgi:hypothetical protein